MLKVEIKLHGKRDGVKELKELLQNYSEDKEKEVLQTIYGVALEYIESGAKKRLTETVYTRHKPSDQYAYRLTGRLRSSIQTVLKGKDTYVYTNVHYAPYVEYGTGIYSTFKGAPKRPILIKPKNKKYLSWVKNGKRIYAKKVVVKGMQARPYLYPAYKEAIPILIKELLGVLKKP